MAKPLRFVTAGSISILLLAGAGCTDQEPTLPSAPSPGMEPAVLGEVVNSVVASWDLVAMETVQPEQRSTVRGSRYTLVFPTASVDEPLEVTIRERDADIIDVDFGPDGSSFSKSVTLEVDYLGTANDPGSPRFNGQPPQLFWFDPSTKTWVVVPGKNDAKNCVYTVQLSHFSRYAMGDGTSGWENASESDSKSKDKVK